jgi:hypothetical protein
MCKCKRTSPSRVAVTPRRSGIVVCPPSFVNVSMFRCDHRSLSKTMGKTIKAVTIIALVSFIVVSVELFTLHKQQTKQKTNQFTHTACCYKLERMAGGPSRGPAAGGATSLTQSSENFGYSRVRLRRIQRLQFGIINPHELVG